MNQTLLIAQIAAFFAVSFTVMFIGRSILDALKRQEQLWTKVSAVHSSKLEAAIEFIRTLLFETVRPLPSVQKLLRDTRKNLLRAGVGTEAEEYVSEALWQGLLTGLIVAAVISLLASPLSGLFLGLAAGALWVMWIRPALLDSDATQRSRLIYRRIPYALDLSVLVLETGGTLREGLEEIALQNDPLAEELRITLLEMDSGATQATALRNMGQRVGLESLETILTAINRGEETGAPMVATLITQAEMFRERRLQEIEKMAVEAPTKMTFPNMMIMMSVLLLIVGPLLIQLASSGLF
jgi:tight adherence protein C